MIEVMTIGYEDLAPKAFLDLLCRCRVQRLVDVRELATSRRVGFAKSALSAALKAAGVDYTHLPELGCPRPVRHRYREDQDWERYTRSFTAYLAKCDDELRVLADLVERQRCCLMCYETDFNFCHRKFVAERLARFTSDLKINHLTGPIAGRVVRLQALAAA